MDSLDMSQHYRQRLSMLMSSIRHYKIWDVKGYTVYFNNYTHFPIIPQYYIEYTYRHVIRCGLQTMAVTCDLSRSLAVLRSTPSLVRPSMKSVTQLIVELLMSWCFSFNSRREYDILSNAFVKSRRMASIWLESSNHQYIWKYRWQLLSTVTHTICLYANRVADRSKCYAVPYVSWCCCAICPPESS